MGLLDGFFKRRCSLDELGKVVVTSVFFRPAIENIVDSLKTQTSRSLEELFMEVIILRLFYAEVGVKLGLEQSDRAIDAINRAFVEAVRTRTAVSNETKAQLEELVSSRIFAYRAVFNADAPEKDRLLRIATLFGKFAELELQGLVMAPVETATAVLLIKIMQDYLSKVTIVL